MKKILTFLLPACILLCASACAVREDPAPIEIISSESLDFTHKGGSSLIRLSSVSPIQAVSDRSWCTAAVTRADDAYEIRVKVESYKDSPAPRIANIRIINDQKDEYNLPVVQNCVEFEWEDPFGDIAIDYKATKLEYGFKTNSVLKVKSYDEWVKVDITDGRLVLDVGENPGTGRTSDLIWRVVDASLLYSGTIRISQSRRPAL